MSISVKKGDTLYSIAKTHGTTVDELKRANGISDPRKLRAGSVLNIPGSNGGAVMPGMAQNSGEAQQGGYKNVVNTDGLGRAYYGYEKIGTVFTPDGMAKNNPYLGTKGVFSGAGVLQRGYLEHESGYKGLGYKGQDGRYYTDYGALLREDGHLYPTGAKVSANGMYYDMGNGWQSANTATQGIAGAWSHLIYSPDTQGKAPGERLTYFDNVMGGTSAGAGGGAGSMGGNDVATPDSETITPEETQAMLNLLEYAYQNIHQKDWEEYQESKRTNY